MPFAPRVRPESKERTEGTPQREGAIAPGKPAPKKQEHQEKNNHHKSHKEEPQAYTAAVSVPVNPLLSSVCSATMPLPTYDQLQS